MHELRLRKFARAAKENGFIKIIELVGILIRDESYREVLPSLPEDFFMDYFGGPKGYNTEKERQSFWMALFRRWLGLEPNTVKKRHHHIRYIPCYRYDPERGDWEQLDRKEHKYDMTQYLKDCIKLSEFAEYIKSIEEIYQIQFPFPKLLSPDESKRPSVDIVSPSYVFRQEGPSWTIIYEGETLRGLRAKGFELIHYLILHKGKVFHTDELSQEIDKIVPTGGNGQGKTYLDHYDESTQTITQGIDAKAKIYGKSMEELKEYRTHLYEELRKAETDPPRKANVGKELEEFNRHCTQYFGLGGQSRKDRDNPMRIKDRICKRIERALDNIKQNNENIWRHFYYALRPINDFFQSYRPDRDISWLTE